VEITEYTQCEGKITEYTQCEGKITEYTQCEGKIHITKDTKFDYLFFWY